MIVIALGRRKNDAGLVIDHKKNRVLARANIAFVSPAVGTELEPIPSGPSGMRPAMILSRGSWGDHVFFLIERKGWTVDDYFIHAARKMGELGIKNR